MSEAGHCAFCAIVDGRQDTDVVFEDRFILAFLDSRPLFPGHTLVVPKAHVPDFDSLPDGLLTPLFRTARLLSVAVADATGSKGTFIAVNNRVSQSVPHVHVHVVPRNPHDGLRGFFWPRRPYDSAEHAASVRDAIREAVSRAV